MNQIIHTLQHVRGRWAIAETSLNITIEEPLHIFALNAIHLWTLSIHTTLSSNSGLLHNIAYCIRGYKLQSHLKVMVKQL